MIPSSDNKVSKYLETFFLTPSSGRRLAFLRIGLAIVLLVQAASISPLFSILYGPEGLVQAELNQSLLDEHLFHTKFISFVSLFQSTSTLKVLAISYVFSLLLLFWGLFTRAAALSCWLLHWLLSVLSISSNYGVDQFANICLFYLTVGPSGQCWSLDSYLKNGGATRSWFANLVERVFQIHLCIIYCTSGLKKTLGTQWWTGEAIWRSISHPNYAQLEISWLLDIPGAMLLAGWFVLAIEIGYPVLMWNKGTRNWGVLSVLMLHAGIALFLGLWSFAACMMVMTYAGYGSLARPGRIGLRALYRS